MELLAGGVVIAQDTNSLAIPEAEFATSVVSVAVGSSHPQLGQNLGIRLVNLNVIPAGYTQGTSPDLEVDFDSIALSSIPIPEPSNFMLVPAGPGQATISWDPDDAGWELQQSDGLSSMNWSGSPSGSPNPVVVPVTNHTRFYRLIHR